MVSGTWSMVLMPAWFALLVQLLDQRERKTGQPLVAYPSMPTFHAALDGKAGRDQQQSNGGEVTDIGAVCRSERDQDRAFWEGFNDHEPDGYTASVRAWSLRRRRWVSRDTFRWSS
jgi:hypothetical protein